MTSQSLLDTVLERVWEPKTALLGKSGPTPGSLCIYATWFASVVAEDRCGHQGGVELRPRIGITRLPTEIFFPHSRVLHLDTCWVIGLRTPEPVTIV